MDLKSVSVQYFALLREQRGLDSETVQTSATTPAALYDELRADHGLSVAADVLKVAINGCYGTLDDTLQDGDRVVFIQPVAGG